MSNYSENLKKNQTVTQKSITSMEEDSLRRMTTVSDQVRFLDREGYQRTQIKNILGISYQHVRGILERPLKRK
jgi:hypothetical protein